MKAKLDAILDNIAEVYSNTHILVIVVQNGSCGIEDGAGFLEASYDSIDEMAADLKQKIGEGK